MEGEGGEVGGRHLCDACLAFNPFGEIWCLSYKGLNSASIQSDAAYEMLSGIETWPIFTNPHPNHPPPPPNHLRRP